ncbi:gluconolactonase precursor [Ilyonectria robusta]|uniref:gluconolactonase precursor n=1 Tax=Ilyonectria robusta TaxID=1079257 RepID=UPI001E8CAA99|nr:gluconolactonase precursor [Ilyonectria robusta]KAH8675227.1 gluconolactonase precursor [Ilyonectria robusta]
MAAYPREFVCHDESATALFGESPQLELLLENTDYPFAHEASVFIQENRTLFITSNQFEDVKTGERKIQISRVTLPKEGGSASCEEIHPSDVPMANGGVNYNGGILFCAQGTLDNPGGLAFMESQPPYRSHSLITSYHGRPFNSVNDVVVHSDGSIWFTDPIYGSEQGIRPKPRLPNQVYRYDPQSGSIRAMADGFGRPNGICFSPDEKTVYVTDTDWIHGDGTTDDCRASSIYAFDVALYSNSPFLTNRRLFAMADTGIPDGIKCDVHGNVYSGCGDGINVWSPGGVLLGKILVEGGAANFCFGADGEVFILNETRIWRAQLATSTKGALLGI